MSSDGTRMAHEESCLNRGPNFYQVRIQKNLFWVVLPGDVTAVAKTRNFMIQCFEKSYTKIK